MRKSLSHAAPAVALLFLLVHIEIYFIILFMSELQGHFLYSILLFPVDLLLLIGAFTFAVFGIVACARKNISRPRGLASLVVLALCIAWFAFLNLRP